MNTEYMKIIESGLTILPRSGCNGYDRLYLVRGNLCFDFVYFRNNRRTSTVEDFKNARHGSHKDLAMRDLNMNIKAGIYYGVGYILCADSIPRNQRYVK